MHGISLKLSDVLSGLGFSKGMFGNHYIIGDHYEALIIYATKEITLDCNLAFASGSVILVAPKIISNGCSINLSGRDGNDGKSSGSSGSWSGYACNGRWC